MKKYYLFDLDGTLIDSMSAWSNKMLKLLDEAGIDYPDNIIQIVTPLGDRGAAELFIEMGLKMSADEAIQRMTDVSRYAYENEIELKKGVADFLKKAKSEGISLNILTASPHEMLDPVIKRNGVYDLFDNLFSCTDFGLSKSKPEIYFEAAKIMGADIEEITFFDDNLGAIKGAKSAGLKVVGVYDDFSKDDLDEIKATADLYANDFTEFEKLGL